MEILRELLPGCSLLKPKFFFDNRGGFVKTYHTEIYQELGVDFQVREEFFSKSDLHVVRGMHFQLPPNAHDKLVYCTQGEALDVLLDLRKGPGYGQVASCKLNPENGHLIYIPQGIAHGFIALKKDTLMLYKTSTVHSPESDCGIRWNSFGFEWGVNQPIISQRDQQHLEFDNFDSPF